MSDTLKQGVNFISGIFKFRKTSLSLFVFVTYLAVVVLDNYREYAALREPQPSPDYLESAWYDLQKISKEPHAYTSHANDKVYSYLYQRVNSYAARFPEVIETSTDYGNGSLFSQRDVFDPSSKVVRVIYFESGNVYVKISGRDLSLLAVLLSAHYDTVPTAYGTTDDGMGIASMLGILDNYSTHRVQPLRSIIFNFNNNEEFGLLGAEAFFNHKWSKNTKYLINLEGTGAGGRAVLFRASNYGIAKYYSLVPSPFASSIFQEGFSNRVVRSQTDYKVYEREGLEGFDIAFYKPRSLYHTYRDSIATANRGSLYHMLSNALALVDTISSQKVIEDDQAQAVYFDILGKYLVIFPVNQLYLLNIVLLVAIPTVVIILLIVVSSRGTWKLSGSVFSSLIRLPLSLVLSALLANWVGEYIRSRNQLIVSWSYDLVLVVLASTFVLANYVILNSFNRFFKIHDQKLVVLLELTALMWAATVVVTVREKPGSVNTGEWLVTVLYVLFSGSSIFGLTVFALKKTPEKRIVLEVEEPPLSASAEDNEAAETEDHSDEEHHLELSETTPLVHQNLVETSAFSGINSLSYDWSIQYLLLVPLAAYFVYFNVHELLDATYQNSHDGSEAAAQFYLFVQVSAVALSIPVIAFVHKLNYFTRALLGLTIIIGTLTASLKFPFTFNDPLKVTFHQELDLDGSAKPVVHVYGSSGYLGYLNDLPSVKESRQNVSCSTAGKGIDHCSYVGAAPVISNSSLEDLVTIDVLKNTNKNGGKVSPYEPYVAELKINVKDNRNCVLLFNASNYEILDLPSPVRLVKVYHGNSTKHSALSKLGSGYLKDKLGDESYKWMHGIDTFQLHKTDWSHNSYRIELQWIPRWYDDGSYETADSGLGVSVSCYWGEPKKVPAYKEINQYSPSYIIYTKRYPGLVVAKRHVDL